MQYDVDVVVVGSGFGGSVAALRAAEKGYSVLMYEAGRRFADDDFAETSWQLRRFLWAPALGCYGIQRIHKLPDVLVLAGAGVGGGSLNYGNTLYRPPAEFYADPQWTHITHWGSELAAHYDTASAMLGVTTQPLIGPAEEAMRATAAEMGVGETFSRTPVGVFFGEPGVTVDDPYFGGNGPARTGCTQCGACLTGCRVGAKNTLVKNYLALAERRGVQIEPMRTVTGVRPLDPAGPGEGYAVSTRASNGKLRRRERTVRARFVVLAAGAFGTSKLLHRLRNTDQLPLLSPALGTLTRTNSEMLGGAITTRLPANADLTHGVAITSSFHPEQHTHIENVRYAKGSNMMGLLATIPVPGGGRLPRFVQFLAAVARHPVSFGRSLSVYRWSERAVIGLVMQSRDNSLRTSYRRRFGRHSMTSTQGYGEPNPTCLPVGQRAMRILATHLGRLTGTPAEPGGSLGEVVNIPLTAHYLGGAVISDEPATGVVDPYQRVWGYPGISVTDGAAVSANLGVNPALTITAQAERAMSMWPTKGSPDIRPAQGAAYRRLPQAAPAPPTRGQSR